MSWTRTAPLTPVVSVGWTQERWEREAGGGSPVAFPVDVLRGKPFDVVGLKGVDLQATRDYQAFLVNTARALYDGSEQLVTACPVCAAPVGDDGAGDIDNVAVFGIDYVRCGSCAHAFVRSRPSEARLDEVFRDSDEHASAYIDRDAAEHRISQIITPKIDWVLDVWGRHGPDRAPLTAVDVGAGGGHFVEGLRRRGLDAEGFELSSASRAFADQTFGLALRGEDVLTAEAGPVDLVTLWGLLEYTQDPAKFVAAAGRLLRDDGLLVVEVPRFDCLGTAAQAVEGAVVARHLDPTSHVNCFSDASLATLLVDNGFTPVAAWYFGMDAYELLMQVALRLDDPSVLDETAAWIPRLQAVADAGSLCDDLVMAAVRRA